jgi:AcrR family transcriptional regulator
MDSQKSSEGSSEAETPRARKPVRKRGEARVQALLAAAESVIAERGVEAATMTEIAERAGASIGSLYQFFPTKALIADALHGGLMARFEAELVAVAAPSAPPAVRAVLALDRLADFLVAHPAFVALADWRGIDPARKAENRVRLRGEIARALTGGADGLPEAAARGAAVLVLALMRALIQLAGEPESDDIRAAAEAMRAMLRHHLETLARHADA